MRWYALKVFYNKVFEMRDDLARLGLECYVPVTTVTIERPGGVKRRVERPLVSSLMFVRCTDASLASLPAVIEGRALIYSRREGGSLVPVPIPDREMDIFMLVTSGGAEGLEYIGEDSPLYHQGDRVRVIDGPFKGSEGHIARIGRDHRLVVTVKGLCAVATSYIPRAFLEKI